MTGLTTTQLAQSLDLTKGRISQLVASGRLDGCFTGDGRARRFDLDACAAALNKSLDKGQSLGNGAKTKRKIKELTASAIPETASPKPDAPLPARDPDRYELAKIQIAEEEARRKRRQNAEAEGHFVLAAEVERQIAQQIGQEVAEFETALRDGARAVADRLGVDYRTTRQILIEGWRDHRQARADALAARAASGTMGAEEEAEDI